jgi:hypothetical protein
MSSRCMSLLPRTTLHSDSEQSLSAILRYDRALTFDGHAYAQVCAEVNGLLGLGETTKLADLDVDHISSAISILKMKIIIAPSPASRHLEEYVFYARF